MPFDKLRTQVLVPVLAAVELNGRALIKPPPSDSRNATVAAISSGCPTRPRDAG